MVIVAADYHLNANDLSAMILAADSCFQPHHGICVSNGNVGRIRAPDVTWPNCREPIFRMSTLLDDYAEHSAAQS